MVEMTFGRTRVLCWISRLFDLVHIFFQTHRVPATVSKNLFPGIDLVFVWTCPSSAVDQRRTSEAIAGPDDLNALVNLRVGLIGMINAAAKDLTICV